MVGTNWRYYGAFYLEIVLGSLPCSTSMQQQAECIVCGNAAFDLLDGLYFCSECGTQSQVYHTVQYCGIKEHARM